VRETKGVKVKNYENGKRVTLLRVAGLCGVLGPVIAVTGIWVAISYAPWFSWTRNSLSDLAGVAGETPIWAARGTASLVFNTSLIIDGILTLLLAIGLRRNLLLVTRVDRLGTLFFFLGACALGAIGLFPKTTGGLHALFSSSFFFLFPLSMLLIGTTTLKSSNKVLGWFIIALGIIGLCSFFIPWPWEGRAISNMISIFPMMVFAIVFGIRLLRQATNQSGCAQKPVKP
jgi:hypothetical membrane protein